MGKKIRKISINELDLGMYVEDVYNEKNVLLLSSDSLIKSPEQIIRLKNQGVYTLYINLAKGKDLPEDKETDQSRATREVEYYKELEKAKNVYLSAMETARETLDTIRKGPAFSISKVEMATEDIISSIIRNPDALVSLCQIKGYDEYTYSHSVNVGVLVASLAHSLGYKSEKLLFAGMGGILHDIGKLKISDSIVNKPGKLTLNEFDIMKKHPLYGYKILEGRKNISDATRAAIIQHHERYNGKGYPNRLKGKGIDEIGLISAVADVYDAMTSDRVYREAWTPQKALAMIFQG
ncbi:MAG: HD-GYP domain-containing protein, partial [bacterium]